MGFGFHPVKTITSIWLALLSLPSFLLLILAGCDLVKWNLQKIGLILVKLCIFSTCIFLSSILSLVFFYYCPSCYIQYKRWHTTLTINAFVHLSILVIGTFMKTKFSLFTFSSHCVYILVFGHCTADFWIVFHNGVMTGRRTPVDLSGPPPMEMGEQVTNVPEAVSEFHKPSCELCFIAKNSPSSCGHIICSKCSEQYMLENSNVGVACPICEIVKSFVEITKIDKTGDSKDKEVVTSQPGSSDEPEHCKLCTLPVYAQPSAHRALRDCGHYTCAACLSGYPDLIERSTFPCTFCRLLGVINGPGSKKEKANARKKLDEARSRGIGSVVSVTFPKREELES